MTLCFNLCLQIDSDATSRVKIKSDRSNPETREHSTNTKQPFVCERDTATRGRETESTERRSFWTLVERAEAGKLDKQRGQRTGPIRGS